LPLSLPFLHLLTNLYELTVWLIHSMPLPKSEMHSGQPKHAGVRAVIHRNFSRCDGFVKEKEHVRI